MNSVTPSRRDSSRSPRVSSGSSSARTRAPRCDSTAGRHPVPRQVQRLQPRQPLPPVPQLLLQHPPPQPLPLPHRVIRVLHRQRLQLRPPVQSAQLPLQHPLRPPVRHHVMHRQQQHVLTGAHPQQPHPQQRTPLQVKRHRRLPPGHRLHLTRRDVLRHQPHRPRGLHHLHRPPRHLRETRPQRLMPRHQHTQRPLQPPHIQITRQPQRLRHDVLGTVRLQPPQEPQPLLRERQRHLRRPLSRHQRRLPGHARLSLGCGHVPG